MGAVTLSPFAHSNGRIAKGIDDLLLTHTDDLQAASATHDSVLTTATRLATVRISVVYTLKGEPHA